MKFRSFSTRLSFNVLLVVSILFVMALLFVAIFSHVLITKEATKSATNILNASIADIERTLAQVESGTQNAAWLAVENSQDENFLYHITQKVVEENPYIIGSAIAFDTNYVNGRFYFAPYSYKEAKTGTLKQHQLGDNYNYFDSEWYRKPMESKEPSWSEPYYDDGGGDQMMATYSVPVKDKTGKVFAVITADISLDWLADKVSSIRPYKNSYATLTSRKGVYLSKGNNIDLSEETILTTAQRAKDPKVMELSKKIMNGETGCTQYKYKGRPGFAVYGPLRNGWSLAITCPYKEVLKQTSHMHKVLLITGLIGLIILFFVCRYTIRKITQPITDFSSAAQSMAKGDFQAQLPEIKTEDEIHHLRDSFEYLQNSLTTYISELKETTKANERMESELNIAKAIQLGMLPKEFPSTGGYSIHGIMHPAKEVGGDLFDFRDKDGKLYFTIGDVSGKGVPAALVMAITLAACRFFNSMGLELDRLVEQLNSNVSDNNDANMFATMFVGRMNFENRTLEYCNAGHNHIIVIPPDSSPYYLTAKPNLAIGLFEDFSYQKEQMDVPAGTKLVLYTDGVTEAENKNQELYGNERLLELASSDAFRHLSAEEMTKTISESVHAFAEGNEQNDDITILCITL